ncbi:MAG TPA: helix-turn-helix transcriptional regulator [Candidatus Binataceae bacterium]|nr:helix-turn-helix transcriptional regulator [Candidatus Binataceae bacterium]
MGKRRIDAEGLLTVSRRLGDAAIDPAIWPEIMERISAAVGATGALLLQSEVRTSDVPRTASIGEVIDDYFASGWHARDIRAARAVPLLLAGEKVVTDHDIYTPVELERSGFYNELLAKHGLKWWAVVGFQAGAALWGLAFQRSTHQGPFENDEKRALVPLTKRLTETATLSKAVGKAVLSGMTNALHLVSQPALALDRFGFVRDTNAAVEPILDGEINIRNRRLYLHDKRAKSLLDALVDQMRTTPDTSALSVSPIVVQRRAKPPLVIRVLPVDGAARSPFLGVRALLLLTDLGRKSRPQSEMLAVTFGLSPAETRLACIVASGLSTEQAAEELGITRATARNQLKAVFAKTDTHRQSELVALLARL